MNKKSNANDRRPAVAGMFYPHRAEELREMIDRFLAEASTEKKIKNPLALIVPHAGYIYSGPVAASAYNLLRGLSFDTIILIGPAHRVRFRGVSVYKEGRYTTPLGSVEIDRELAASLLDEGHGHHIHYVDEAHRAEHSLEVQLPFIQHIMNKNPFKILPLLMGEQTEKIIDLLAGIITPLIQNSKKKILVIASTDLSHYHPYEEALKMDTEIKNMINNFKWKDFLEAFQTGRVEACGGGPMTTAMKIAESLGSGKAEVLDFRNSGDISGDKSRVVGYLSAVLY